MNIILTSIGTRGDMEPFLAIGEILKERGHTITCLFPEQFRSLAEDAGFSFESLGSDFIEMLESPAGRVAMGGGKFGFKKLKAYMQLISMQKEINKQMIIQQQAVIDRINPDRIVHNGKTMYPIIWGLKHKNQRIFVSPVPYLHYVKDHAHVVFNRNFGPLINKFTYWLANYGLIKTISGSLKWLNTPSKIKTREIKNALFENKVIYTVSPTLFECPNYWEPHMQVLGYHERKKTVNWAPSEDLNAFLQSHSKAILVTFGSMINEAPHEKTKIILDILTKHKIPAIINTASGGLVEPENYDKDLFLFVNRVPYDWIFPKLYGVIHHGGSGTTHSAVKYGCTSLILPHIIDQYIWNKIIYQKKLGPLGVDISKITSKNLTSKILDFYSNNVYKKNAIKASETMHRESFQHLIHETIVS